MSYRDNLEAASARVAALERELAIAKRRIADLEGGKSTALVPAASRALATTREAEDRLSRFAGAAVRLTAERVLEGELAERAHTDLIEHLRQGLGTMGTVTTLPGSIAWTAQLNPNTAPPHFTLRIVSRDGKTIIHLEESLTQLAGGIVGGLGLGVGVSIGAVGLALIAFAPVAGVAAAIFGGGGTFGLSRSLYRRKARERALRIEAVADELVELARPHLVIADSAAAGVEPAS